MRGIAAALCIVAACGLGDRSKHCGDYVCPETYACVPTPAVCAPQADIAACYGASVPDYNACTTSSGSDGVCYQGVCAPCDNDREGCSTNSVWSTMVSGTSVDLHAVWFRGFGDGYAGGDNGTLLHYDGISWSPVAGFPAAGTSGDTVSGIWGDTTSLFVATSGKEIFQFDGTTWTSQQLPAVTDVLNGIAGVATGFVVGFEVAVGWSATIVDNESGSWSAVNTTLSGTSEVLNGVAMTSTNDVVVVGNVGRVVSYDGSFWTVQQPLPSPYTSADLYAAWEGGGEVLVVGKLVSTATDATIARHKAGVWSMLTAGKVSTFRAVWGPTPSLVFIGGDDGTIVEYYGGASVLTTTATPNATTSIFGLGGNSLDAFAVGAGGTIWRRSLP